jgi:hypothetical protein
MRRKAEGIKEIIEILKPVQSATKRTVMTEQQK